MSKSIKKTLRVRKELLAAGVTPYGMSKSEAKALPGYIRENEHILGVIYGQFESTSAMMVATDRRLLFIDIRPLHNIIEDVSYDLFGDILIDERLVFSRVVVRTRPREYLITMVNKACARNFLNAVERMAISGNGRNKRLRGQSSITVAAPTYSAKPSEINFLRQHYLATVSTRADRGYPYGATVYYIYNKDEPDLVYFITKSPTATAINIEKNPKVSLTITDEANFATMHLAGVATVEKQAKKANHLISMLFASWKNVASMSSPPVTQIKGGSFKVYRIDIQSVSLKKYV